MTVQKANPEMSQLLSSDFQRRNEPNFAVANMVSTALMLPELRGLWSASVVDENGAMRDLAAQGRTLTNTGAAPRGVSGLVPYVSYNGATQYHSRADEAGLDITGAQTVGGWFWFTSLAATPAVVSKWNGTGNQASYILRAFPTGECQYIVSVDGTTFTSTQGISGEVVTGAWYFMCGRFTPSAELALFCNLSKYNNVAGIPATIFNSSAALIIGGVNAGPQLSGRAALVFLCAAAASDAIIRNFYEQTRAAFGV